MASKWMKPQSDEIQEARQARDGLCLQFGMDPVLRFETLLSSRTGLLLHLVAPSGINPPGHMSCLHLDDVKPNVRLVLTSAIEQISMEAFRRISERGLVYGRLLLQILLECRARFASYEEALQHVQEEFEASRNTDVLISNRADDHEGDSFKVVLSAPEQLDDVTSAEQSDGDSMTTISNDDALYDNATIDEDFFAASKHSYDTTADASAKSQCSIGRYKWENVGLEVALSEESEELGSNMSFDHTEKLVMHEECLRNLADSIERVRTEQHLIELRLSTLENQESDRRKQSFSSNVFDKAGSAADFDAMEKKPGLYPLPSQRGDIPDFSNLIIPSMTAPIVNFVSTPINMNNPAPVHVGSSGLSQNKISSAAMTNKMSHPDQQQQSRPKNKVAKESLDGSPDTDDDGEVDETLDVPIHNMIKLKSFDTEQERKNASEIPSTPRPALYSRAKEPHQPTAQLRQPSYQPQQNNTEPRDRDHYTTPEPSSAEPKTLEKPATKSQPSSQDPTGALGNHKSVEPDAARATNSIQPSVPGSSAWLSNPETSTVRSEFTSRPIGPQLTKASSVTQQSNPCSFCSSIDSHRQPIFTSFARRTEPQPPRLTRDHHGGRHSSRPPTTPLYPYNAMISPILPAFSSRPFHSYSSPREPWLPPLPPDPTGNDPFGGYVDRAQRRFEDWVYDKCRERVQSSTSPKNTILHCASKHDCQNNAEYQGDVHRALDFLRLCELRRHRYAMDDIGNVSYHL